MRTQITSCLVAFILGVVASAAQDQDLDTYGGFLSVQGTKTGFFHSERINGRWWLITPEGHGFFGIGIAHPVTGWSQGAVTFAYGGSQEAWLRDGIEKMRDLGYNVVWSGPYCPERTRSNYVDKQVAERVYKEAKIPYAFPVPLIKHRVELKPGEERPDVFSDEYIQFVRDQISDRVPRNKDDPWIMGYYYGFGSFQTDFLWINETLARTESPGRERLLGVLEERYQRDITKLNKIYGTDFASFESLKVSGSLTYPPWVTAYKTGTAPMPEKSGSQEMFADAEALLGEIVEQVHRLAHSEIRKYDKNHMIFGTYVKESTYTAAIWRRIAPYVDTLSPQHLNKRYPIGPLVESTGKPALLSDQTFGNVYPLTLQGRNGASGAVPEHVDRNLIYDLIARRISIDPHLVGISFCACLFDQSHWEKPYERGQPGFFTIDGVSRPHLCRTVRDSNRRILESVPHSHDEESIKEIDDKYHQIREIYSEVMRHRREFLERVPAVPVHGKIFDN